MIKPQHSSVQRLPAKGLYRISGDLTNTDNVLNNTFWIGVQPSLTNKMLEFAASKIENYLGVNF